ncbi:unnamed protein product [Cuscuta europaea]|uniref:Uncharacterized protein n=1 Tax=Cuscuta europaea TaxID=41803 RepID=A0A9P0YSD3_CUSEU|nr:unnamed protein product [Cuscuta europaea]
MEIFRLSPLHVSLLNLIQLFSPLNSKEKETNGVEMRELWCLATDSISLVFGPKALTRWEGKAGRSTGGWSNYLKIKRKKRITNEKEVKRRESGREEGRKEKRRMKRIVHTKENSETTDGATEKKENIRSKK